MRKWKEYFEEVLNEGEQRQQERNDWEEEIIEQGVEVPTYEEFQNVIRALKQNKSPGQNGVVAEFIKAGGQELRQRLYELVAEIWETEKMPEQWEIAVLYPIHKKGDKMAPVCSNYRE